MDKIALIKAEIERHIKHYEKIERNDFQNGELYICQELLSFIDTLSEEPDKSLEEEIDRFEDWMETYNQADYPTSFTTRDIARHFAQWGADHTPLPEDTVIFQKGIEEGKRLMMEDAVEYEVVDFSSSLETHPHVNIPLDNKKYRSGDKVRLIVLPKEDEK